MATVKTNVIQIDTQPASKSIKDLRKDIKDLKDQMAGLEAGSDAFIEAANKAGELQHQVDEISQAVRGASSDFGDLLGNVSKIGAGFSGAFQTAAAALNLLGVESSNVTKAIQKMQSMMAITQGLTAIDAGIKAWRKLTVAVKTTTIAQKLYNAEMKASNALGALVTGGTKAFSAALKGQTVSTVGATIATRAFSMALKAIGIGIIIEGVNLLIEGIKKLIELFNKWKSSKMTDFTETLQKMTTELNNFQARLQDTQAFNSFTSSIDKAVIGVSKMRVELTKLTTKYSDFMAALRAHTLDEVYLDIRNLDDSFDNLGETFSALNNSAQNLSSLEIPQKLKDDIKGVANDLGNVTKNGDGTRGITNLLAESYKMMQPLLDMLPALEKVYQGGILSEEEAKSLQFEIGGDKLSEYLDTLKRNYNNILVVRRSIQTEIDNINIKIAKGGLTDAEVEPQEALKEILENYKKYFDNAETQLKAFSSTWSSTIGAVQNGLGEVDKNLKDVKAEQAEIFKAQIDGRAARDAEYKESADYLRDQILYNQMLLGLQQEGTAQYTKTLQTIQNLRYQIKMLYKDLKSSQNLYRFQRIDHNYVVHSQTNGTDKVPLDLPDVYVDENMKKNLEDKVEGILKDLDKIVIPHITTWKDALRDLIWDVGHQFEILTNTMSLYQESSLGLSGNYVNAANDIKKTFNQLMQNIVDGGDAGWTQWTQMAGNAMQAAGSMLNALSAEQDTASEEGFESQKKLQIGATVMNMLSGIMMAWSTAMELGPILGPIAGAANSALIAGIGAAQIAKIKGTTFGGEAGGGYATTGVGSLIAPVQYTANVADATKERDVRDTRVYVTEHDITDTQRRVQVAQSEARF